MLQVWGFILGAQSFLGKEVSESVVAILAFQGWKADGITLFYHK